MYKLGWIYCCENENDESLCAQGLKYSINAFNNKIIYAADTIGRYYEKHRDYVKALYYYEQYQMGHNSISAAHNVERMKSKIQETFVRL